MFQITPIGSCRIRHPLRDCVGEYGIRMNLDRLFGYTHSSAEAVQQMCALSGDFRPDNDVWPLIAPSQSPSAFRAVQHQKSNLYIVELSSAKVITIGEYCIQLNYLYRVYADFFSDNDRALKFSHLCRANDPDALKNWLRAVWSNTVDQRNESRVLGQVRITISDEQSVFEDMQRLQAGLGNVLFVTHVNAKKADNSTITSRNKFIGVVTNAAKRTGAALYNPTALMEQIGQENTIEDHSTALAHFTGLFNRRIFGDWYEMTLKNMIEESLLNAPDTNIEDILIPHARGVMERGNSGHMDDLADLLDAVEGYNPRNDHIQQMQLELAIHNKDTQRIIRAFS